MDNFLKKVLASALGALSIVFTTVILYLFLHVVDARMLKAGYLEGQGTGQFIRVFLGIPAFFLVGILWVGFILYVFNRYFDGLEKNRLAERFFFVTSIQCFMVPILVVVFVVAFSTKPQFFETTAFVLGIVLGVISRMIQQRCKRNRLKAEEVEA